MDNSFIALGLMSGTSLDGIDASIIKSDGENNLDIIDNKYFNYPEEFRKRLSKFILNTNNSCLLYTSPSPRDRQKSRMPSSA